MIESVTRRPNTEGFIEGLSKPRVAMDLERAYYQALFRRDFLVARVYYRSPELQARWNAERLRKEAHKCGIYDEADKIELS